MIAVAGSTKRFNATITISGTLTDPGTLTLKIKEYGQATVTYTYAGAQITKTSTGVYYKDVVLTYAGKTIYQWVTTGTAADLVEGTIDVVPSLI